MMYKLAPSMMCCDLLNVKEQIEMFEKAAAAAGTE